ncbi:MAG: hypothetical protein QXT88_04645 [Desulfurococcaceae archaeon]|uniref:Uncharacterized protein n=1 Tax=Staphylothermus marinus TaxID=2280 RepID=A0A7J3KE75_STAMA
MRWVGIKAAIPIIIASVVTLALIVSSLYFITSVNVREYTVDAPYSVIEWIRIDKELNELTLLLLRESSRAADTLFEQCLETEMDKINFRNADQAMNQLINAVNYCSIQADNEMDRVFNLVLNNWIDLKRKEGFIIVLYSKNSTYYVGNGYGYSNVFFRMGILNLNGEYRVFIKNSTLYFGIALDQSYILQINQKRGLLRRLDFTSLPGINITMIFETEILFNIGGTEYYVALDRESGEAVVASFIRGLRGILRRAGYSVEDYEAIPEAIFFFGEGYTWIVYQTDSTLDILEYLIVFFGNRVSIGLTTNINVDGVYARAMVILRNLRNR